MKSYEVCPWNYTCIGLGCKKPNDELCPMSNVGAQQKPMTNADRIRAMTDEELAVFICEKCPECTTTICPGAEMCNGVDGRANGLKKWLQQPAEGD